jgi:hypothetical protein
MDATIPQHICDALALIEPASDQRAICITRIERAFRAVRSAGDSGQPTPARQRNELLAVAKALRVLEAALTDTALLFWGEDFPREEIRRRRKVYEEAAELIHVRDKSGPRGDRARETAVRKAHELLVSFGGTPTRTSEGAWHLLAELLYGDPDANLFQNIRDYRDGAEGEEIPY